MKTLGIATIVLALGFVGNVDMESAKAQQINDLHNQMSTVCHNAYKFDANGVLVSRQAEVNCSKLIEQVEASGKYQVLTNGDGYYSVGAKY